MEPRSSLSCSQEPATFHHLNQINAVRALTAHFFHMDFNIVVPSTPRSSSWSRSFKFRCQCSQSTNRPRVKWHRCSGVLEFLSLQLSTWLCRVELFPGGQLHHSQLINCPAVLPSLTYLGITLAVLSSGFWWFSHILSGSNLLVWHEKEPSKKYYAWKILTRLPVLICACLTFHGTILFLSVLSNAYCFEY
jgi:hypothetical protein